MARLGQKSSAKESHNGRLYFGNKTQEYLKQTSRQAVEEYHNAPILYFEIDWEQSKRNFYGEMTMKKLKSPRGIEVRGAYKITQSEENAFQGLPNKLMSLVASFYVESLEELHIEPKLGDYFAIGWRVYQIYDKTIPDVGPGNLILNRERMRIDFKCLQEDTESYSGANMWSNINLGYEADIKPGNSDVEPTS
jgi:hypothetical protein